MGLETVEKVAERHFFELLRVSSCIKHEVPPREADRS